MDQQRRVGMLVRRTEQVIVLARVKKPLETWTLYSSPGRVVDHFSSEKV